MKITPQTWKIVGIFVAAMTPGLTDIVLRHWANLGPDLKDILDIISALAMIGGGGAVVQQTTARAQVENVSALSTEDTTAALNNVSPAAKVVIAGALPGVSVKVDPKVASADVVAVAKDPAQPYVDLATPGEKNASQ